MVMVTKLIINDFYKVNSDFFVKYKLYFKVYYKLF